MVSNKLLTLAFVRDAGRILLGYKKRGFGEGRWNGFGGKVQTGETIPQAAKRELEEECGLTAEALSQIGVMMFEFEGKPQLLEVHVFSVDKYSGTVTESDEMLPLWFKLEEIPFKQMWTDDELWFPYLLKNQHFYGYFKFKDMVEIDQYDLKPVDHVNTIQIPQSPVPVGQT